MQKERHGGQPHRRASFPRPRALYRTAGPAAGTPDRTLQEIFSHRAERNRRGQAVRQRGRLPGAVRRNPRGNRLPGRTPAGDHAVHAAAGKRRNGNDERHIRRILFRTAERGTDVSPLERKDNRRNTLVRVPDPARRTDRLSLRQRGGDPHSHRRHILRNYRYGQRLGRSKGANSRSGKIDLIVSARAGGLPVRALIRPRLHRPG